MKKIIMICMMTSLTLVSVSLIGCSKSVESKPNYIYKKAPDLSAGIKINGEIITKEQLFKGIEYKVFQLESQLFQLKMGKVQALAMEKLMAKDPKKKGLSNDAFLEKYVSKGVKVTDKEVKTFLADRNIPIDQHSPDLLNRAKNVLLIDKKRKAIENWIAKKTQKNPIEVFLTKPKRPVYEIKAGNAPYMGGKDAKVTIVEFSDFQCPFCAKGAKLLKDLKSKYGNKIKVAFRNFPLPFHNHAKLAAIAGLCANEQNTNNFWKLHDLMFENQQSLDLNGLKDLAKKAGIKLDKFSQCLEAKKYTKEVENDLAYGKSKGVESTPTFYVNGKLVKGAEPIEVFSEIIDEELSK